MSNERPLLTYLSNSSLRVITLLAKIKDAPAMSWAHLMCSFCSLIWKKSQ